MTKTYRELIRFETFEERFMYLKLSGVVGQSTFGYDRYINQALYGSGEWLRTRDKVIFRDGGCDLGIDSEPIRVEILVHHIEPLTLYDIENMTDKVFDLNNLITTRSTTHKAIHYGNSNFINDRTPRARSANDTCPWRLK